VFTYTQDPIARGLVVSQSRPEGNLTGFAVQDETLLKLLAFLRELKPDARSVGYLFDPANTPSDALARQLNDLAAAADRLHLRYNPLPVHNREQLEAAIPQAKASLDGIIVESTPLFMANLYLVPLLAKRHQLPALYRERSFAQAEGLLSYGEDIFDLQRRAAGYVDRLLRGVPISSLPVQHATKIELVINLRTARALRLEVPLVILAGADELID
jgi:putative ABC transport system substrate-binding protein